MSKERIRRARKKIAGDHVSGKVDSGFRVLKVDTSNMADVYYAPDALDKAKLDLFVDNIKPDRTPEDLLFQVMLDWGVDLGLPISKQTIQGNDVFFVDDNNALAACFDANSGVDETFVKELAKRLPLRVVFTSTILCCRIPGRSRSVTLQKRWKPVPKSSYTPSCRAVS